MRDASMTAAAAPADNTCGLTVCEAAAPHLRLAKTWRADGCEPYGTARTVNLYPAALDGLDALHRLLARLAARPRCCVLRGAIADPARARGVRRLLHDDHATGERATLREAARRWVALDVDGLPLPEGTDPRALPACARAALPHLPPAFRVARCVIQATASHGIKPGARLRLWFWLDRPTRGAELATWLAGAPVDASAFRPAQPIYTAAPLFEGRRDPLPARLALLDGAEPAVRVPPAALLTPTPPPPRPPRPHAADDAAGARALAWARARIAAQREGARHDTALSAAGWLAALARRGEVAPAAVVRAVAEGIADAGKPRAEGERIAAFALAKEGLAR